MKLSVILEIVDYSDCCRDVGSILSISSMHCLLACLPIPDSLLKSSFLKSQTTGEVLIKSLNSSVTMRRDGSRDLLWTLVQRMPRWRTDYWDRLFQVRTAESWNVQGGPKKVIPLVQCNVMYERYHFFGPPCMVTDTILTFAIIGLVLLLVHPRSFSFYV